MRVETVSWLVVAFVASGCVKHEKQAVIPSSQRAEKAVRDGVELDPREVAAEIERAKAEVERGKAALESGKPPEQAKAAADSALAALRRSQLLGSYHASNALHLLGRAERELGHNAAAHAAFEEEIRLLQALTPFSPSELARALDASGATYLAERNFAKAEPLLTRAYELHRAATPPDRAGFTDTLITLADLFSKTNRPADAKRFVDNVLERGTPDHRLNDSQVYRVQTVRADLLFDDGKPEAAVDPLVQASAAAARLEPAMARRATETLERLASAYWKLERRDAAIATAEEAFAKWQRYQDSVEPAGRFWRLSEWYRAAGQNERALDLYRRSGFFVRSVYPGRPGAEDGEPVPKKPPVVPKPPASAAETPKTGNITNAAKSVAAMRADFRACYQRALDKDRNVAGSVRVCIRVGAEGAVDSATGYSTNLPRDLVDCIVSRATVSRFDPPEGGAAVVNVPVNLVKQ